MRVHGQHVFVPRQSSQPHVVHPIQRRPQGDASTDVRRARLELVRELIERGPFLETHGVDHFTATPPRRHGVEQRFLAVQDADAGGPVRFVATERVKIHVEVAHVHGKVRHGLRPIDQHGRPHVMGPLRPGFHVVHRAQGVGHVGERHQLGFTRQVRLKHVSVQGAVFVQLHDEHLHPALLGEHLPRHDVAVVLHPCQHDAIALGQVGPAPGLGNEVDAVGRASHKEHLLGGRRVEVGAHRLTGRLIRLRGLLGQGVHPAVDVAVAFGQVFGLGLNDRHRLVGRRRAVKVGQRLAMHLPAQDGELRADGVDGESLTHDNTLSSRRRYSWFPSPP